MFPHFHLMHTPALFVAFTMTFGGMWPLFNARAAMLEFGLPRRITNTRGTTAVFQVGNARTTVIGLLVFHFYFRNQFAIVDAIMAITGAYCGLIDSYVVWREGNAEKALFRLVSSGFLSAWGYWGLTAGR